MALLRKFFKLSALLKKLVEDKGNLDKTNYLDFLKAFQNAPPRILLRKIDSHVIQGKALVWIKNCSGRCVHRKQD